MWNMRENCDKSRGQAAVYGTLAQERTTSAGDE